MDQTKIHEKFIEWFMQKILLQIIDCKNENISRGIEGKKEEEEAHNYHVNYNEIMTRTKTKVNKWIIEGQWGCMRIFFKIKLFISLYFHLQAKTSLPFDFLHFFNFTPCMPHSCLLKSEWNELVLMTEKKLGHKYLQRIN